MSVRMFLLSGLVFIAGVVAGSVTTKQSPSTQSVVGSELSVFYPTGEYSVDISGTNKAPVMQTKKLHVYRDSKGDKGASNKVWVITTNDRTYYAEEVE
jgi:hypothetical protein